MNRRLPIIVLLLTCLGPFSHAQVPAFETFAKDRSVTYVYVSKAILSLARSVDYPRLGVSLDIRKMIDKLDALQVISADGQRPSTRVEKTVGRILQKGKYTRVMQLDEDGEEVTIYQGTDDRSTVLVMCAREDASFKATVFSGSFTLDEIVGLITERNNQK